MPRRKNFDAPVFAIHDPELVQLLEQDTLSVPLMHRIVDDLNKAMLELRLLLTQAPAVFAGSRSLAQDHLAGQVFCIACTSTKVIKDIKKQYAGPGRLIGNRPSESMLVQRYICKDCGARTHRAIFKQFSKSSNA